MLLRILIFLKSLKESLKTINQKIEYCNLSRVNIDQLIMIAIALNQGSSTRWFNSVAVIYIESRKPIGLTLPVMCKHFCDTN